MAGQQQHAAATSAAFREQRARLVGDIGASFERVLANINQLNRSLEAVVTVGNEFASVDALWAQFEGVMGRDQQQPQQQQQQPQQQHEAEDKHRQDTPAAGDEHE